MPVSTIATFTPSPALAGRRLRPTRLRIDQREVGSTIAGDRGPGIPRSSPSARRDLRERRAVELHRHGVERDVEVAVILACGTLARSQAL
jgi:hypothetical protein